MALQYFYIPIATVLAVTSSQLIKLAINLKNSKSYAYEALFKEYGGMPSTHSALVVSTTSAIFFLEGFSTLFWLAVFWAAITIADAMAAKWYFGLRDQFVNEMYKLIPKSKHKELKEFEINVGHSKLEILAGAILGTFVSYITLLLIF